MTADPSASEESTRTAGWTGVADLIDIVRERLADAVPVLARLAADVERDWPDERGRLWGERAELVRRTLVHELDAVLEATRLVGAAIQDTVAQDLVARDPVAQGPVAQGPVAQNPAAREPADGELPVRPPAAGRRAGGPRLGDTDAQRVDDERGVRIARLGDSEPG